MKINSGFISNSSTTSFCVAKVFLTKEQLTVLVNMIDNNSECNGESNDNYILYQVEHSTANGIFNYLDKNKIKYIAMET
jgi:hypothetical protein